MHAFKSLVTRRRLPCVAAALGASSIVVSLFAGCGSPTPIIPRGAWSVSFIQKSSLMCKIGGHNTVLGEVSADKRNKLISDGDPIDKGNPDVTVSVNCSVSANGSNFSVSAGASAPTAASQPVLNIVVNELSPTATRDNPSKGTVAYQSKNTANVFNQVDCIFYFKDGTPQVVKEGQVWMTFECDKIAAAQDNVCEINPGYVAFENCDSK